MSADPVNAALLDLAEAATTQEQRLHYLLEAALRPGLVAFLKAHVVAHGGPKTEVLPDIYMSVFASLSAEMIENYMANTGEHAGARKALRKFLKERFAKHLDQAAKASFLMPGPPIERPDA